MTSIHAKVPLYPTTHPCLEDNINNLLTLFMFLWHIQAFGLLSCILFAVDVVLNYRIFQDQRDHEESSQDQGTQETAQRRVWDINHEYLRTAGFKIKFVEMV